MLAFLPGPMRGAAALLLYTANTSVCFALILPFVLLKALIPAGGIRHLLTRILTAEAWIWIGANSLIMRATQKIRFDVKGTESFNPACSYLVISNHRSWADILILQHLWKRRIPFLKFFIKQELIWVPLLGIAWWALDFPFMKRYSRQFLEKHPELKGKDIETTRRYCEKFRKSPISVINFPEGTRFDETKRKKQNSPYNHLLMPRAGGTAVVLSVMGDCLEAIIDVTIVYPDNPEPPTFWEFLKGKVAVVSMRARRLEIPAGFISRDYENDPGFAQDFRNWINSLWEEKDRQIQRITEEGKRRTADGTAGHRS